VLCKIFWDVACCEQGKAKARATEREKRQRQTERYGGQKGRHAGRKEKDSQEGGDIRNKSEGREKERRQKKQGRDTHKRTI
jgi:hypothetical protein